MLAAGLLAKKAVERGLSVPPTVKPSLAPGSRVVTDYYEKTGLQPYLDRLGFNTVGYGCTTCIGNSGPLDPRIESVINEHDIVTASVLSGNRNFEARVHQSVRANFLCRRRSSSPSRSRAASTSTCRRSLGEGRRREVYLRDIWPSAGRWAGCSAPPPTRKPTNSSTATSPSRTRSGTRFRA